jgi:hypothetical protein
MNFSSVLSAVLHRWYVALLILTVTAYGASRLWTSVAPEYSTSSVVSVVATQSYLEAQQSQSPTVVIGNPYKDSASTLASLLADSLVNGNVALPIGAERARVDIASNPARSDSFFTVQATGPSAEAALSAILAVEEQAPALLADIQQRAGAPADQLFTTILARPATDPVAAHPGRARLVVGIALVGVLVAALACVFIDGLMHQRQRPRRRGGSRSAAAVEGN